MLGSIKKSLNCTMGGLFSNPASLAELKDVLEQQQMYAYNLHHYHEVYPGIFLGDAEGARDLYTLAKLRITHILNAAYGTDSIFYVDTDKRYYTDRSFTCEFKGIPAIDIHLFNLSVYFYESTEYIDSALKQGGRVYVHCFKGVSRSAALVIVYLMIKQKLSALEALKLVRGRRAICPNDGFLQQICELDDQLKRQN